MEAPATYSSVPLKPVWIKAAVIGGVWAALEIVLGSFLHNLRVPMTGTMLTACGMALLIAGQRIWPERGLAWRAGLICAMMKAISPSAVIIGPMIGILSEALVVQACVSLLGYNAVGLTAGAALALLEPAIHRIVEMLLLYGWNAALVYVRLVQYAGRVLHVSDLDPAALLAVYLGVNLALGVLAGILGLRVARRVMTMPPAASGPVHAGAPVGVPALSGNRVFHAMLLPVHAAMMVAGLTLIGRVALWQAAAGVAVYTLWTGFYYPNVRRVFRKPRRWIELLIMSALASLLLGNLTSPAPGWTWQGLEAAGLMALQALLVTSAFASISSELRNPRIVDWCMRRGWGTLAAATEMAFAVLPSTMGALGEEKKFLRHPVESLARVLAAGVNWLERETRVPAKPALPGN